MSLAMVALVIAGLLAGCGSDEATACDDLELQDAFVRLPGGENTAMYVNITNNGETATALVGAESDVAGMIELHEVGADSEGVMQMRAIEGQRIELPAGQTVVLEPGGLHVMAMGVTRTLEVDEEVTFTLTFDDGCTLEVTAPVRAVDGGMSGMGEGG
jgi:copper(I)-binding protein